MVSTPAFATLCQALNASIVCVAGGVALSACQGYPFELRLAQQVTGRQLDQDVSTPVPADILFVIDNSGSMLNQRRELIANLGTFISQMARSANDFHLGIVTTDVECNIPSRNCSAASPQVSAACCEMVRNGNLVTCTDVDADGDGRLDGSNCDAGRLRAPLGQPLFFNRPQGDPNAWVAAVSATISNLGCNGSGYEAGLEAARRAVACSLDTADCPSAAVAQLNAGFVRPQADLVVVFVSDEDDCSFFNPTTYLPPTNARDAGQQGSHLCSPAECYAYYGAWLDDNHDGLQNWADPSAYSQDGGAPPYACGTHLSPVYRSINPPYPDAVDPYLAFFVAAKGGDVSRVRAAGIVSAVSDSTAPLGYRRDACVNLGVHEDGTSGLGVTNACGCWSASAVSNMLGSHDAYCAVTQSIGGLAIPTPANEVSNECSSVGTGATAANAPQPGCKALPAGRYVDFLERLSAQRVAAGVASNTLVDSICRASYSQTLFDIVNTVILANCFNLGVTPRSAQDIDVRLNGVALSAVAVGGTAQGWSWQPQSSQVCLEGGLHKNLGDSFAIFVIQPE